MKIIRQGNTTVNQETYHINGNGVLTVVNFSVFISWFYFSVSASGNAWTLAVRNRETTPKYVIAPILLNPPGTAEDPTEKMFNPSPKRYFWMEGGIDIVTAGTTPGTIDVWVTWTNVYE